MECSLKKMDELILCKKKKKYYCVEALDMILSLLLKILNIEIQFEHVVI